MPSPDIDLRFNPRAHHAGASAAHNADYEAATTLGHYWILHDAHCRALPDEALEHGPSWHEDLENDLLLRHVDSVELYRRTAGAPTSGILAALRVAALRAASLHFPPSLPGRTAGRNGGAT